MTIKNSGKNKDHLSDNTQPTKSNADSTIEHNTVVESDSEQKSRQLEQLASDPLVLEEERLKAYARLLDSAIRLPGGFRIGLDGIVGLIPGIGDILGAGLSGYFIYAASRLDIPKSVIARMIINTLIETVIGAIPFFGDIFDFIFKANDRNARLLHTALEDRSHTKRPTGSLDA